MKSRIILDCTLATIVACSSFASQAQVASPNAAAESDALAEIVVTAEKRESNIMTTAVALNALSGSMLKERSVTDLEDLTAVTPSFSYSNQGPTSAVNIRGIGLSVTSPNVAPGVPIYRDGLLAPTLLPNEPFLDIADVEVLRGPQGTLVGSNSTGGAVFINTRSPAIGHSEGYVEAVAGSFNRFGVQGAYNVPVNDEFALRGAFSYERHSSYWTDLLPSSTNHPAPGEVRQLAARFGSLYEPTDHLSVLFKLNFQDDQNGGMPHVPQAGTNAAIGYPTEHYVLAFGDQDTQYSDYQIRSGLEVKFKFKNDISLRSMTGFFYTYEYYNEQAYVNPTTTTVASSSVTNRINDHVWSQEFNLLSPEGARLHWVAGTFSQFWPAHVRVIPNTVPDHFIDASEGTTKVSNAVFGELGYDLTASVEVHAGVRETFDHAYGSGGVYIPSFGNLEVQSTRVGQTDNLATGRVGVNWKATDNQFVYAFAAKGGKTGGINASGQPVFSPETVYDYEGGIKSDWFSGHLRSQVGAFFMKYNHLQLAVLTPAAAQAPVQTVTNVGASTVKGSEFSLQAQFSGFRIDGNLAFVQSSVSAPPLLNSYLYAVQGFSPSGAQCTTGQTANCFDYTPYYQSANGVASPYSPKWTGNLGAEYTFRISSRVTLTPRADFSYTSKQYSTIFQNPIDEFQERKLVNAHINLAFDGWNFRAYGTNLTHQYFVVGYSAAQNFYNAPAEYGIRITKTF